MIKVICKVLNNWVLFEIITFKTFQINPKSHLKIIFELIRTQQFLRKSYTLKNFFQNNENVVKHWENCEKLLLLKPYKYSKP